MMKFDKLFGGIAIAVLMCFAGQGSANIWTETGNAGDLPGTAQDTSGYGPLTEIIGNLNFNIDTGIYGVDLFRIQITDPANFSAMTNGANNNVSDPALWLFDASGHGVEMNDDQSSANLQSSLPPTSPYGPLAPGNFLLGISWTFYDAISNASDPFSSIFPNYLSSFDTTGIYGPGNSSDVLAGWTPDSPREDLASHYDIQLTGATFAVPEPSTLLLFGLASLLLAASARRRT
jgi:hypothetical protein